MATLLNSFSSSRGFNAPRDLASVERIEFLNGTAAALYGSSEPGGMLNIVSTMVGMAPWQIREQTGHKSDAILAKYFRPVAKRKIPSVP